MTMETARNATHARPSAYHRELMAIYIWPFVFVVICTVLGTLGNAVVLYIYTFKWKHTKTRVFILNLALLDFVNSIFNMPVEAYILWHPLQFDMHVLCKMTRGVTFVINNVCACIFVAIAVDRLLLLYKPFKRRMLTVKYAKQSCLAAFVIGSVTGWPGFVFYGSGTLPERLGSVTVVGKTCYISDRFLVETTWPSIFSIILFVLMLAVFVILTVSYIVIGRKIYLLTQCDIDVFAMNRVRKKRLSSTASVISLIKHIAMGNVKDKPGEPASNGEHTQPDEANSSVELNRRPSISAADGETEDSVPTNKVKLTTSVSFGSVRPAEEINVLNGRRAGNPTQDSAIKTIRTEQPRMSRRISGVNTRASRDNTLIMAMITIAFIVCFLPYLIIVTLRYKNKMFYFDLDVNSRIAYHVFLRMYFLNSVVNPFIYSFASKQFRLTVLKTLKTLLDRGALWKRKWTIRYSETG